MLQWIRNNIKGDPIIWMVVLMLSLVGVLAVYSSVGTLAFAKRGGNTEYFLIKHVGILLVGIFIMWMAHLVDFNYYSRPAQFLIYLAIAFLLYTLFFGATINSAGRWVPIPFIGLTFQPSDLAKLALILYLARFLSKKQTTIGNLKSTLVPALVVILITCGLIAPADLSTALVLFATSFLLLFIGRIPMKYLMALVGIGAVGLTLMITFLLNTDIERGRIQTWKARIENYMDFAQGEEDVESYQNEQAKIAIAQGGILGKGAGKSTQRNFLPSPYADFIFAIIVEEYGLVGGLVLIVLYLLLLFRTVKIVIRTPKAFGALLAVGLSFSLVIQALINMGVAVHLFPVTGLPMPLVSMGGTSLIFTSIALGIILSVSRTDTFEIEE